MPASKYLISCIWWNVDFVLFIFVPGERDQFRYLIFLPLSILGVLNKMTLHHQLEALLPTKSNYFPLWFFKSMVISKWVWYVINQVIFLAACVFDIWLQDKRYSLLGMSSEWGCIMPTSVHLWARTSSYLHALGKEFLQMMLASSPSSAGNALALLEHCVCVALLKQGWIWGKFYIRFSSHLTPASPSHELCGFCI